jgi:hypothetical protein
MIHGRGTDAVAADHEEYRNSKVAAAAEIDHPLLE